MAYKKKVNGHKRSQDAGDRARKRRERYHNALAKIPVPRNVKRYVADKLDQRSPDNRFAYHFPQNWRPQIDLNTAYRFYPFGIDFSTRFVAMEHKRLSSVSGLNPYNSYLGKVDGAHQLFTDHENDQRMTYKIGRDNHWADIFGRGIHMKSASIYGTIYVDDTFVGGGGPAHDPGGEGNDHRRAIFDRGELKLHMFVLEDKKVTKEEFLEFYRASLTSDDEHEGSASAFEGPAPHRGDMIVHRKPYIAGSKTGNRIKNAQNNSLHAVTVCMQGAPNPVSYALQPNGSQKDPDYVHMDDFLVDWRKFYDTNAADNPPETLFYNEPNVTCGWDGTRDRCRLPVNKARYIVHEHKIFDKSNFKNGACEFSYSFPDHWVNYDKQILDMPFVYNNPEHNSGNDSSGLHSDWVLSHKQPYVVFVYTHNGYLLDHNPNIATLQKTRLVNAHGQDPFLIDFNFKCHYENPIATAKTPSIRQSQPHIYKREPHSMDNPRSMHLADEQGLDRAYASPDGTYVKDGVLYIAGSGAQGSTGGLFGDMGRWHYIPEGHPERLERHRQSLSHIHAGSIHTVVGHSMGGSVAEKLAMDDPSLRARLYGTPRISFPRMPWDSHGRIRSFRHSSDPVSIFDFGADEDAVNEDSFMNPHGYRGYDEGLIDDLTDFFF